MEQMDHGKSSLVLAVGLNVIMAWIFCSIEINFILSIQKLFTRILNADNIFRGVNNFVVEMGELRGILKRSDDRSYCFELVVELNIYLPKVYSSQCHSFRQLKNIVYILQLV